MQKHYAKPHILQTNQGNNAFNFDQRKSLIGEASLTIPSLKIIENHEQIAFWDHIVFEEIDHAGTVHRCAGLKHIYQIPQHDQQPCIVIMDNHNHALYFWGNFARENKDLHLPVIHIDQHADLAEPDRSFDATKKYNRDYLRYYTNYHCNVGSFIKPAIDARYITKCIQVRTGKKLIESTENIGAWAWKTQSYILDIDCDFRLGTKTGTYFSETIEATRTLIAHASLVTIATSPYFMKQDEALHVVDALLN